MYRAVQNALDREVAIKVLTLDDAESVRRFTREVQLMVALGRQHPNIAKVLQIGTSSLGRPCIVMDYYELGSLDQHLSRVGPLSAEEVTRVGTVIADALAFAHSKGVLHRDVKPQNILILPTSYVLSDFGIARLIDSAHTASSDRFSYRHASPQMLDGMPPSENDDVFSLGATLFHLLDGKPPFTTTSGEPDSALAYIKRVRSAEPRPLTRPDLPPALVDLIGRCLRKDPSERPGSATELHDQLATLRTNLAAAPSAPHVAMPPPPPPPPPTRPAPAWGGTAGQVRSTDDLTSMRFLTGGPPERQSPAPGVGAGRLGGPPGPVSGPPGPPPYPETQQAPPNPGGSLPSPPLQPAPQKSEAPQDRFHFPPPAAPGLSVPAELTVAQAHSAHSASEGNLVPTAPAPPRVPRLSIALGGIALGILLVIVLVTLLRTPEQRPEASPVITPAQVATPVESLSPSQAVDKSNPNLAPRNLKITITGEMARATWDKPVDEPEGYYWAVSPQRTDKMRDGQPQIPGDRTVDIRLDASWREVCIMVVGHRGGQYGADQACARR